MARNCDEIRQEYVIISCGYSYQVYFSLGFNLVTTLSKSRGSLLQNRLPFLFA